MAFLVQEGIKLAFGLVISKIRNEGAKLLRHGDVTEQHFREFIIRELDDIKSMLQGLCRADLMASIDFLSDGVILLYHHLRNSSTDDPRRLRKIECSLKEALSSAMNGQANPSTSDKVLKIVQQHIEELREPKENSDDTRAIVQEAKAKFKEASNCATKAFCNEGLTDQDRILALKIKMAATLLQFLHEPMISVPLCRGLLEQLNQMPIVRKACQVQFGRGIGASMKKKFNNDERTVLINTISMVNRTLWQYVHLCASLHKEQTCAMIQTWPCIMVGSDMLHPVHDQHFARHHYWKFGRFGVAPGCMNYPTDVAIDSKGHFIISDTNNGRLSVWDNRGQFLYNFTYDDDWDGPIFRPRGVTVDSEDCIYVCDTISSCVRVFTNCGKYKRHFEKPAHLRDQMSTFSGIHIDTQGRVLVSDIGMHCIHAFSIDGQYLCNFGKAEFAAQSTNKNVYASHITSTRDGKILITDAKHNCIVIYDDRGLYTSITLPGEGFLPIGIAFSSITDEIIVSDESSKSIKVFTITGEYCWSTRSQDMTGVAGLALTSDGYIALVDDKSAVVHVL